MKTYIVIIFLEYIFSLIFTREVIVVCARVGGANTTPFMAAHFAKQNTKFGGGGKRGRAKIPSPQPPSFLPARAFRFCARSAQSFGVLLKKSSNINQKRPLIITFWTLAGILNNPAQCFCPLALSLCQKFFRRRRAIIY